MVTNKIIVSGPRLHTGHEHPRVRQRTELRNYFGQFGNIINVTVIHYNNSTVTFDNCDSAAKCIQQRVHKIGGHDFFVKTSKPTKGMKKELKVNPDANTLPSSSENASVPNSQIPLPPGLTNRIYVAGPPLYPEQMNSKAEKKSFQKEEFRMYFGQFGQITTISMKMAKDAKIVFDNCESAAKCIQQRTHRICGRDFVVRKEKPTQGMKDKIRANLRQNMSGPPSGNLSAANVQSNPPVESNVGNESPQSTASSSSEGSIIFCGTISRGWAQGRGLASFDKPGSASHENVSAANVQSNPPAESNVGIQSPASNSTQVQGSITDCSTISREWAQGRGLASFDKPG
ncbi:hypothetical protein Ddc_13211 [Ditylenchus destructor]|nr:hypothetical protein Ddc_13211 [Ditylenchus destructor]